MSNSEMKIYTLEAALPIIQVWKQSGLEVVFTNGCFDILHTGHIRYLKASADLGDRLIVAVNADASVRKLKGDTRPINTLSDRMEVLAALSCVDMVIMFTEETPQLIIEKIIPDIITKGGDYTPATIVGADFVSEHDGKVVVIQFEDGYSTTATIQKMNQ